MATCLVTIAASRLSACQLCEVIVGTLSDQIGESTIAVIAHPIQSDGTNGDVPRAAGMSTFRVAKVLKGATASDLLTLDLAPVGPITGPVILYAFGSGAEIQWLPPEPLSSEALRYVHGFRNQATRHDRLKYRLPFLAATDPFVHDDAYNEFARASFAELIELRTVLDRRWVRQHLERMLRDPMTAPYRIRLLWTLLGVCGESDDTTRIETLAQTTALDHVAVGMDAALACYMTLAGKPALDFVRDRFLNSDQEDKVLTGLGAIRFHAAETQAFSHRELSGTLHGMLRDVRMAGYAIPELARLQDWTVADRLLALYAREDAKDIRLAIVNYLRSCPRAEFASYVDRCERIDPAAVGRSKRWFPDLQDAALDARPLD